MKINGQKKITVPVFSNRKYIQYCKKNNFTIMSSWNKDCDGRPVIGGKVWVEELRNCISACCACYASSPSWEVQKPLTPELEAEAARSALELLKRDQMQEVAVVNPCGKLGVALGAIQDWLDEYPLVDTFNDTLLVYEVGDGYLSMNIEDPHVVVLTKLTDRSEANGKL